MSCMQHLILQQMAVYRAMLAMFRALGMSKYTGMAMACQAVIQAKKLQRLCIAAELSCRVHRAASEGAEC